MNIFAALSPQKGKNEFLKILDDSGLGIVFKNNPPESGGL
jgi:hypothetical protein